MITLNNKEIIENVRASFAMEDMKMAPEDENHGMAILTGEKNVEQVIKEIQKKYEKVGELPHKHTL